jgi:CBS domain-containing protein
MMVDCDCGGIPVCQNDKLVGFVTDRDIVCRVIASGQNPLQKTAQDAMTSDLHTLQPDMNVDECIKMMQKFHVRRAPVVDQQGTDLHPSCI